MPLVKDRPKKATRRVASAARDLTLTEDLSGPVMIGYVENWAVGSLKSLRAFLVVTVS